MVAMVMAKKKLALLPKKAVAIMVASPKITLTIPTLTNVAPLQVTTMSHAATVAEPIDILVVEESIAQISTIPHLDVVVISPKVDIPEVVTVVLAKVTPSLNPKLFQHRIF
ncbi:hypothetical protein ACFX1Z_022801 [Malus domestica]